MLGSVKLTPKKLAVHQKLIDRLQRNSRHLTLLGLVVGLSGLPVGCLEGLEVGAFVGSCKDRA